MKGKLLIPALSLLAAACLLMVAGGLPYGGEPGVLRGGVMLALGVAAAAVCAVATVLGARGRIGRLAGGVACMALAVAGAAAVWEFGCLAAEYAGTGGIMWFGAAGMAALSLVGLLFIAIFGYLGYLAMRENLWTPGMHAAIFLILVGACVDGTLCEQRSLICPVHPTSSPELSVDEQQNLPFRIRVRRVEIERYDASTSYAVLQARNGKFEIIGEAEREGDAVRFGKESWKLNDRKDAEGWVLPGGKGMRLLMRRPRPVREYRVYCHVGDGETNEELLRVNHPLSHDGWKIYLMDCTQEGNAVRLLARRAPGRPGVIGGSVLLVLCAFGWGFSKKGGAA